MSVLLNPNSLKNVTTCVLLSSHVYIFQSTLQAPSALSITDTSKWMMDPEMTALWSIVPWATYWQGAIYGMCFCLWSYNPPSQTVSTINGRYKKHFDSLEINLNKHIQIVVGKNTWIINSNTLIRDHILPLYIPRTQRAGNLLQAFWKINKIDPQTERYRFVALKYSSNDKSTRQLVKQKQSAGLTS